MILNDNNTYLIELYKDFYQTPYNDILNHVQGRVNQYQLTRIDNVGENGFKDLRNLYNQQKNPLDLFVLVAFSFNHQIRFNNAHDYNSSFAWGKHLFNSKMKDNLCLFVHALQSRNVFFVNKSFDEIDYSFLTPNDLVYCDPPYLISTAPYNDGRRGFSGWNGEHERKLLELLSDLDKKGIKFALSNVLRHKNNENKILLDWVKKHCFNIHNLTKDYYNCNHQLKHKGDSETIEVLITNY